MSVYRQLLAFLTLAAVLGLAGCAQAPSVPEVVAKEPELSFPEAPFGQPVELVSIEGIFALGEERQNHFLDFFNAPVNRHLPAHLRVHRYLVDQTESFDFHNDTFVADEAFARSAGNCLSLAIITTALANLVDVDVGYQLIEASPVYELRGDVGVRGLHVRSLLYEPQSVTQAGRRGGIKIDYFPDGSERFVGNLSEDQYFALYYSNVAAESIARGETTQAYWHLREALRLAPKSSKALNMMAVVYHRAGDPDTAERIYRYGIDHLREKVSFLRNYRALLLAQDRADDAAAVTARLDEIDEPNPFDWLAAGRSAYGSQQYEEAIRYYRRAIALAPYLHEGYLGVALSQYELGDTALARRNLEKAIENSRRQSTRSLYEAKLAALTAQVAH